MPDYSGYGNEQLKPLAIDGNKNAIKELKNRGNTLDEDGRLVKKTRQEYTDSRGNEHVDEVTVADGKIIERNGVPIAPNS